MLPTGQLADVDAGGRIVPGHAAAVARPQHACPTPPTPAASGDSTSPTQVSPASIDSEGSTGLSPSCPGIGSAGAGVGRVAATGHAIRPRKRRRPRCTDDNRVLELERQLAESNRSLAASVREKDRLQQRFESGLSTVQDLRIEKRRANDRNRKQKEREANKDQTMLLPDGKTQAPLVEAHLVHRKRLPPTDPLRPEGPTKRQRDYCPVVDQILKTTRGPTEARPSGGWGYRLEEKLWFFDFTLNASQLAASVRGKALERDSINRASAGTLRLVLRPLSGTHYRDNNTVVSWIRSGSTSSAYTTDRRPRRRTTWSFRQ